MKKKDKLNYFQNKKQFNRVIKQLKITKKKIEIKNKNILNVISLKTFI